MNAPPNGRRNGLVGTVLDRVFGFVDKPWKGLFILALLLVCAISYAVWEERAALLRVMSHPKPTVMRSELSAVALNILNKTTVEAVSIWEVSLATDIAQLIIARKRGGEVWIIEPTIIAAIHEQSHPVLLARAIRGEVFCADPKEFQGPLGLFLIKDGWGWVCTVPEPPSNTELVIGMVSLVWRGDPGKAYTQQATQAVRLMTDEIVMR